MGSMVTRSPKKKTTAEISSERAKKNRRSVTDLFLYGLSGAFHENKVWSVSVCRSGGAKLSFIPYMVRCFDDPVKERVEYNNIHYETRRCLGKKHP